MVSVYDTAGNVQNLDLTWTKKTAGWELTVTDPTGKATISTTPTSVTFGTDGKPTPATSNLNVTWEGGSAATTIALNLSGVATIAAPSQALGFDSNGNPPGSFKDVTFDKAGNVMVTFSNGNTVNYARVPLAVFDNMNALQEESPGFFTSTAETGEFTLQAPGSGVAGTIVAGTYEGSTTDGTATYVNLIQNYRNLSGNFKPIEIIQKVYDDIRKL
jgi:flagellar hook protein FlgE